MLCPIRACFASASASSGHMRGWRLIDDAYRVSGCGRRLPCRVPGLIALSLTVSTPPCCHFWLLSPLQYRPPGCYNERIVTAWGRMSDLNRDDSVLLSTFLENRNMPCERVTFSFPESDTPSDLLPLLVSTCSMTSYSQVYL